MNQPRCPHFILDLLIRPGATEGHEYPGRFKGPSAFQGPLNMNMGGPTIPRYVLGSDWYTHDITIAIIYIVGKIHIMGTWAGYINLSPCFTPEMN